MRHSSARPQYGRMHVVGEHHSPHPLMRPSPIFVPILKQMHAHDIIVGLSASELVGLDGVVAVGGDGLFHEVTNGMMALREKVSQQQGLTPGNRAHCLGLNRDLIVLPWDWLHRTGAHERPVATSPAAIQRISLLGSQLNNIEGSTVVSSPCPLPSVPCGRQAPVWTASMRQGRDTGALHGLAS